MPTIDEKRVYDDRTGKVEVYVATAAGVVVVDVSDDLVGGFAIDRRCTARDVAADGRTLAVATDEDVLVRSLPAGDGADADEADREHDAGGDAGGEDDDGYLAAGFGPAVAVGVVDGTVLAAAPDGRIARAALGDGRVGESGVGGLDGWTTVGVVDGSDGDSDGDGDVDADGDGDSDGDRGGTDEGGDEHGDDTPADVVRAIDGDLVAAAAGVYRVGDRLLPAGLSDVRDVAAAGTPLAAAGDGLYKLGNGWMKAFDGPVHAVAAAPDGRAHAVADRGTYARDEDARDGDAWTPVDLPTDGRVVDVAYGPGVTCAVTADGTALLDAGDGWRSQALGLRDVTAAVVGRSR